MLRNGAKTQRVIQRVRQSIEVLRIPRIRHKRIRTDKPAKLRVIPTRIVVAQPLTAEQAGFVVLPDESFGRKTAEGAAPVAAPSSGSGQAPG